MHGLRHEFLQGIPDGVYDSVRQLEDSFAIGTPGLKIITARFIEELEKGLSVEGSDVPMNVTWVIGYPSGQEEGRYLTLDMGGTCLRVCDVTLAGRETDFRVIQAKCKMPDHLKTATADELWDFIAERLLLFIREHNLVGDTSRKLPLAWTFSYPVTQESINNGILQRWTKSLDVPGVVGCDVVPQLQAAFQRKQVPVDIVALVNDTTGTLIASAYRDPEIKIGSIISTGCNAAYMENRGAIPKIEASSLSDDALIAINTECGAFGSGKPLLPRTRCDEILDRESQNPGSQIYEKMVAGLYLGELLRLVLIEMHTQKNLFLGQDVTRLQQPYVIDTPFLTAVEEDVSASLEQIRELSTARLGLEPNPCERKVIRYLVEMVGTRAARLYACSIAAICKKRNIERCHVGVDGAVFSRYSNFRRRAAQALREILDWPHDSEDLITFREAVEGSAIGAALIAALALERGDKET